MVLNYFNYAIRLLIRNPLTTLIHVTGLTVGFGAFLMLWPYAEYELRSDQYHSDANRIARLAGELKWTDDDQVWKSLLSAFNNWGVAHEVATTFPNVEAVTRIVAQLNFNERVHGLNNYLAISTYDRSGNKNTYRETRAVLADPNLFQFFSIPLLEGNAQNVLETPNSVVISETLKKSTLAMELQLETHCMRTTASCCKLPVYSRTYRIIRIFGLTWLFRQPVRREPTCQSGADGTDTVT